jgi:hypothetical protein
MSTEKRIEKIVEGNCLGLICLVRIASVPAGILTWDLPNALARCLSSLLESVNNTEVVIIPWCTGRNKKFGEICGREKR